MSKRNFKHWEKKKEKQSFARPIDIDKKHIITCWRCKRAVSSTVNFLCHDCRDSISIKEEANE